MATRPNRRDLIKMGAAAGGIAVAGPIVTTFNVPAAAALTSACTCTGGQTLVRKEVAWSGTTWQSIVPALGGACAPGCFTGTSLIGNQAIDTSGGGANSNSPRTVVQAGQCTGPDEGIFLVTAIHTDGTCVGAGGGSIVFTPPSLATITAAPGKTLSRIFVVGCCSL